MTRKTTVSSGVSSRLRTLCLLGGLLILVAVVIRGAEEIHFARLGKPLVSDLLAGAPCAPPCWQGIAPGETSQTQALNILRESPYVREDSIHAISADDDGEVTWQWRVSAQRMSPSLRWQDGIVQEIVLGLPYDLTVAQIVKTFGPPEALIAGSGGTPEHWYWIVDLYYPNSGIQFKAYTSEYSSQLEAATSVEVVYLFVPTSLEMRVADTYTHADIELHVLSTVRAWQGYGDLFKAYYESPQTLELTQ